MTWYKLLELLAKCVYKNVSDLNGIYMTQSTNNTKVIIRFSHIGDIILQTNVLYWRYKEFNEQFILITQKGMAEIFKNNPAIIHIEEFEKADLKGRKLLAHAKTLAKKYPYPLYDMHKNLRSSLIKMCWNEKTHTYSKDALARRLFMYSKGKVSNERLELHVVERYASVFQENIPHKSALAPKLFLDENEKKFASDFFAQRNAENKKIIALHPFATNKGKLWSIAHWQELYAKLIPDYFPIFIGKKGKNEENISFDWIKPEHNALDILSLRQSAALLSLSSCLVTGDSAPLHLASSVQTRIIALFGATVKEWGFYPLGDNDVLLQEKMPCSPCSLHGKKEHCPHEYQCINAISADSVLENIR